MASHAGNRQRRQKRRQAKRHLPARRGSPDGLRLCHLSSRPMLETSLRARDTHERVPRGGQRTEDDDFVEVVRFGDSGAEVPSPLLGSSRKEAEIGRSISDLTAPPAKATIPIGEEMAKTGTAMRPLSSFPVRTGISESANLPHGLCALPRGAITEILGDSSTGRTALAHSMLATATLGEEVAVWIDCHDSFDPASAVSAGADLGKMLWVQCGHRLETAVKAADMVLQSGGFGLIVLDLCDVTVAALQRVPLSYWYRIRRAVEHTPSILLILARQSVAKSCSTRQLGLDEPSIEWRGLAPFQTIVRLESQAVSRKPFGAAPVKLDVFAEAWKEA
jgi:hypothetical protein